MCTMSVELAEQLAVASCTSPNRMASGSVKPICECCNPNIAKLAPTGVSHRCWRGALWVDVVEPPGSRGKPEELRVPPDRPAGPIWESFGFDAIVYRENGFTVAFDEGSLNGYKLGKI